MNFFMGHFFIPLANRDTLCFCCNNSIALVNRLNLQFGVGVLDETESGFDYTVHQTMRNPPFGLLKTKRIFKTFDVGGEEYIDKRIGKDWPGVTEEYYRCEKNRMWSIGD